MSLALTLHQIGVPCVVYEAVPALQPLGVGINLQPMPGARVRQS